jgi:hypothetical protein
MNTSCPNGRQICPSGIPAQFLVMSDQAANLFVSINNAPAGSYSNVTSQSFSLTPNPNYNPLRVVGSNSNGSTEMICAVYGTTPGENGSYWYYDENNSNNIHLPYEILQGISAILNAGGTTALIYAANALYVHLQGLAISPPGGVAVLEGARPGVPIALLPRLIDIHQSIPDSYLNLTIGQNTVIQYNSDYSNNRSGQGTILVNGNQSTIFWGPENWA